jgi:hypothetical protein
MKELRKKDMLDGCNISKLEFYEHCIFGKHKREKFNASVHTTKVILDFISLKGIFDFIPLKGF